MEWDPAFGVSLFPASAGAAEEATVAVEASPHKAAVHAGAVLFTAFLGRLRWRLGSLG